MIKVFIDGSVGTTGLRIEKRLASRTDIELLVLPEDLRKDTESRKQALNGADIAFLCLPDVAAVQAVELIDNAHTKVIDASTAHRTAENWAYGFAELDNSFRTALQTANRVAVPGCHASGFLSLAYPLVKAGILPTDYPLVCHSLTGYSGGGKKMIAEYEDENRSQLFDAPRQYGITQTHKHLPEMQKIAKLTRAPIFNPIVCDYYSGMEVTLPLYAELLNGKITKKDVLDAYKECYKDAKLVSVEEADGALVSAKELSGKDCMKILVGGNDERIVPISVFDNLGKGASGAAIQCMNIMCGFDETASLIY